MRNHVTVLIAGLLILTPSMAMAAVCKLENATFRPKYAAEHFEIRSSRVDGVPGFGVTVRKTNETFRFRVDADRGTGAGTITSVPDAAGQDPRIRTNYQLLDGKGLKTTPAGEVGHVSFLDLGRAFVDSRMRTSRNVEPYTSPPSGLWHVTDCRLK
ncbi:hypothetical protein [Microvirga sp. BSC39]|uniref:hypothetical protein n=1 Tax=Microvirga sp. BSC39 TaxID=1549810 RepID=UPI0004E8773D|nr:hypothetical protein [Microvirga sp. BSC39]KFG66537.1 hypothetical protein JH26_28360 [Microvirga sp. BSC39]